MRNELYPLVRLNMSFAINRSLLCFQSISTNSCAPSVLTTKSYLSRIMNCIITPNLNITNPIHETFVGYRIRPNRAFMGRSGESYSQVDASLNIRKLSRQHLWTSLLKSTDYLSNRFNIEFLYFYMLEKVLYNASVLSSNDWLVIFALANLTCILPNIYQSWTSSLFQEEKNGSKLYTINRRLLKLFPLCAA